MSDKLKDILDKVKEYEQEKLSNKKWEKGKDFVQYAGPVFDEHEAVAAVKTILEGWLVLGHKGLDFEKKFSKILGCDFGVLTNSGSSSNLIMMQALKSRRTYGLPDGTRVITPIAGFPTTVNPIFQSNFLPTFVDIDLDTLNLNLEQVEEKVKLGAKVITFAHVLGNPPNMDKLMEIVKDNNLLLLEDCCDALDSTYKGKRLGSFGEFSSCSFYPAHHITMGEGGFVATDTHLKETVARSLREWGRGCYCVGKKAGLSKKGSCGRRFDNWLESIPDQIFDHKYVYDEIGYNLKPIEVQAAMGLEQLKKLPSITQRRKENHADLCKAFSKHEEHFILPKAQEGSDPNWFAFAVTIKDGAPFTRNQIVSYLEDNKIQTRPYFAGNIMLQPAYKGYMDYKTIARDYPNARKVTTDTFFLGTSPVITKEQIDYVEEKLDYFIKNL
jgi:CDP-6-deoxy-D-xylo-4-hexulose-3-dehydrase